MAEKYFSREQRGETGAIDGIEYRYEALNTD